MPTAERIINLEFYGARVSDTRAEDIERMIKEEPETVIKWLLDYIGEVER